MTLLESSASVYSDMWLNAELKLTIEEANRRSRLIAVALSASVVLKGPQSRGKGTRGHVSGAGASVPATYGLYSSPVRSLACLQGVRPPQL